MSVTNPRFSMRGIFPALLLLLSLQAAAGEPLWQTLPPTPAPVRGEHSGRAAVNGISLYYATIGRGPPVILLHGGLSNSDYWGNQVRALAPHRDRRRQPRPRPQHPRCPPLRLRPDGR